MLWKCSEIASAVMPSAASASSNVSTRAGVAMPVVSPKLRRSAPPSRNRAATRATRASGTSPSYGQPNAVDTIASTGVDASCASAVSSAAAAIDSSTVRFTLRWLCVSLALTTTSISSTAATRASSAPFTFGTRAR